MILGTFTQYTGFNHRRNPERESRPQTARVTARKKTEALKDKIQAEREFSEETYWDDLLNGVDYKKGAV